MSLEIFVLVALAIFSLLWFFGLSSQVPRKLSGIALQVQDIREQCTKVGLTESCRSDPRNYPHAYVWAYVVGACLIEEATSLLILIKSPTYSDFFLALADAEIKYQKFLESEEALVEKAVTVTCRPPSIRFEYDKDYLKSLSEEIKTRDASRSTLGQSLKLLMQCGKGLDCGMETVLARISEMNLNLSKYLKAFQRMRAFEAESNSTRDRSKDVCPLQGLKTVLEEHMQVTSSALYSPDGIKLAHCRLSSCRLRYVREREDQECNVLSKLSSYEELPGMLAWEDMAHVVNLLHKVLGQEEQIVNLKCSKARHFDRALQSMEGIQHPERLLDELKDIETRCMRLRRTYETSKLTSETSCGDRIRNETADREGSKAMELFHDLCRKSEVIEDELLNKVWHDFSEFQVILSQMVERHFPRDREHRGESLMTKEGRSIVRFHLFHSNQRRQFIRQLHCFSMLDHPFVESMLSYDVSMSRGLGLLELQDPTNQNLFAWLELKPSLSNRWRVLFQILLGIVHLHAMKIVHCLINPHNILMSGFSEVSTPRISNFSCSMKLDDLRLSSFVEADLKDATLDDFVAPELKEEPMQRPNFPVDVFSFGCVLKLMFYPTEGFLAELLDSILAEQPSSRPSACSLARHRIWSQQSCSQEVVHSREDEQQRALLLQEQALLEEERKRIKQEEESLRSFYDFVSSEHQKLEDRETQLNLMQCEVEERSKAVEKRAKYLDRSEHALHAKHQMMEDVLDHHLAQEKDLEDQKKRINEEQQGVAKIMNLYKHPSYWSSSAASTNSQLVDVTEEMRRLITDLLRDTSVVDPAITGLRADRTAPIDFKIRQIQRVENPRLWKEYAMKRASMAEIGSGGRRVNVQSMKEWMRLMLHPQEAANEVLLFHGTPQQNCSIITEQGFDERVSNRAGHFGTGIYFAENCTKSLSYCRSDDSRFLFLTRVLLGDPHFTQQANSSLRRPPNSSSTTLHDSVIGTPGRSAAHREFVTYDRTQTYPEFLIHIVP